MGNWPDVDASIARNADSVYPRVFPVVAAAADAGNQLAQSILGAAAAQLAAMAARLAERLELPQRAIPIAKVGGTVGRSKYFDAAIDRNLSSRLPDAAISAPAVDLPATAAKIAWQVFRHRPPPQG
jgi:N-acetylglucosamine kinase-like BadF-type ATPase